MGRYDEPDNEMEGQLTIEDYMNPPERLIAVSRIFARARKEMSLAEQKTFVYALAKMNFTEEPSTDVVRLDKKTLARIIGINSDPNHLSVDLYNEIKELPTHSFIEICDKDIGLYSNGFIVTAITRFKNIIRLRLNKEYMPLFTGLSGDYITLWSSDIFKMSSKRSAQFYEYLRQITDTRKEVNDVGLGVKALKNMFNIPQETYMREKGGFDRRNFENRVIEPICADLAKCKMINLVVQPDGKYYVKEKHGKRVSSYRFYWTFTSHPAVATAAEVKQIQERVDKDPEVLKVAKDILTGEKRKKDKPKEKKTRNSFNNFKAREYDFEELERQLLQSQRYRSDEQDE